MGTASLGGEGRECRRPAPHRVGGKWGCPEELPVSVGAAAAPTRAQRRVFHGAAVQTRSGAWAGLVLTAWWERRVDVRFVCSLYYVD